MLLPQVYFYLLLAAIFLQFFFSGMKKKGVDSLLLNLASKWVNTFSYVIILAYIFSRVLDERPAWVLFLSGFLIVLLLDSLFVWFLISLFSRSMRRRFVPESENENSWRPDIKFIALKAKILMKGFSKVLSTKASVLDTENPDVFITYFLSTDSKIRLQVDFYLAKAGSVVLSFFSQTQDGKKIFTMNADMPIGILMPENYDYSVFAWTKNFDKLLAKHIERISSHSIVAQEIPTVKTLYADALILEKFNIDEGILNPVENIEEDGVLTLDGKYKLWVETLKMNYLGLVSEY